jgi:hypothetical protein
VTSNRPLEDWGKLLGHVPMATAILDRFPHHADVLTIAGRSYHLRQKPVECNGLGWGERPAQTRHGQTTRRVGAPDHIRDRRRRDHRPDHAELRNALE